MFFLQVFFSFIKTFKILFGVFCSGFSFTVDS